MAAKKINLSKKAIQIDKATQQIIIITAVAAFIIVLCIFASSSLWGEHKYLNRVDAATSKAKDQLDANVVAMNQLTGSYKTFVNKNSNIIGGAKSGTGANDGNNATIILDALPSQYDFPALMSSLQKVLGGFSLKITSITGTDDPSQDASSGTGTNSATTAAPATATTTTDSSAATAPATGTATPTTPGSAGATTSTAVPIPFSFSVSNLNYDTMQQVLDALNRSIRPMQIDTIQISGGSDNLTMSVTAHTYYQPGVVIQTQSEVVK